MMNSLAGIPNEGEMVMKAISKQKRVPGRYALVLGLSTLMSAMANSASACSLYSPWMAPAQRVMSIQGGARLMAAVYHSGFEGFIPVANDANVANSIVGLWKISMISDGVPPNPVPE